jgi:hypothetical protein
LPAVISHLATPNSGVRRYAVPVLQRQRSLPGFFTVCACHHPPLAVATPRAFNASAKEAASSGRGTEGSNPISSSKGVSNELFPAVAYDGAPASRGFLFNEFSRVVISDQKERSHFESAILAGERQRRRLSHRGDVERIARTLSLTCCTATDLVINRTTAFEAIVRSVKPVAGRVAGR